MHCRAGVTNPQNKRKSGFLLLFFFFSFLFVFTRPTDSLKECYFFAPSLSSLQYFLLMMLSPWLQHHCELVAPGSGICCGPPTRDWHWGLSSIVVRSLKGLLWCLQPVSECKSEQEKFFPELNQGMRDFYLRHPFCLIFFLRRATPFQVHRILVLYLFSVITHPASSHQNHSQASSYWDFVWNQGNSFTFPRCVCNLRFLLQVVEICSC